MSPGSVPGSHAPLPLDSVLVPADNMVTGDYADDSSSAMAFDDTASFRSASVHSSTFSAAAPAVVSASLVHKPESLRLFRRNHQMPTDVGDQYAIANASKDMREARWNEIKDVNKFDSVNTPMAYGDKMVLLRRQQRDVETACAASDLKDEYAHVDDASGADVACLTAGHSNVAATKSLVQRAVEAQALEEGGDVDDPARATNSRLTSYVQEYAAPVCTKPRRRWDARTLSVDE